MQNTDSLLWEYGHLIQELQTCNDYFAKRKIEARMNVINALSVELLAMENECIECCSKLELAKSYINDSRALEIINDVINTLGY